MAITQDEFENFLRRKYGLRADETLDQRLDARKQAGREKGAESAKLDLKFWNTKQAK